ncbi:metallothionein [Vreelandella titanicae]|uniref:metallothionein n=1 Tax=Halomonadaceae TaxID=28256 RepID=UPI00190F1146|nr:MULTISPECIES: metallothionein [Halomonas]
MAQQECACPKCKCAVDSKAVKKDGKLYRCEYCATGHANGSSDCGHDCQCGK